MSVHPSRQPLIRINKTGEMRLRNKVGDAILRENAHEERALGSQLVVIEKHQARQDKYLTYRQLDFACRQVAASEERPCTIASMMALKDSALPPIQSMNLDDSMSRGRLTNTLIVRRSDLDLNQSQNSHDFKTYRTRKGSWEKGMALIRLSLQNRQKKYASQERTQAFLTQETQTGKEKTGKIKRKERKDETIRSLPLLAQSRDGQRSRRRRGRMLSRKPSFPEMIKFSREKSMSGLKDPRFLKLESCLGGGNASINNSNIINDDDKVKTNNFYKT